MEDNTNQSNGPVLEDNRPSKGKRPIINIVVAVIVALLAFGAVSYFMNKDDDNKDPKETAENLLTSEEEKEYVSTEHGFRVRFPGFPQVDRDSLDVQGVAVPYTIYSRESDNSAFTVGVVDYPAESFDFSTDERVRTSLEGSVNGSAQTLSGTIESSEFITFLDKQAIRGHIIGTRAGTEFSYYTVNFLEGSRLYQIAAVNVSESEFDNFLNTFKLDN